jgi:hypothetical protein
VSLAAIRENSRKNGQHWAPQLVLALPECMLEKKKPSVALLGLDED